MIIPTTLPSTILSFLIFFLSPAYDALALALVDDSQGQDAGDLQSSENQQLSDLVQVKTIQFPVLLSDGTTQTMAGFIFWDPNNFANCLTETSLFSSSKNVSSTGRLKITRYKYLFTASHTIIPIGIRLRKNFVTFPMPDIWLNKGTPCWLWIFWEQANQVFPTETYLTLQRAFQVWSRFLLSYLLKQIPSEENLAELFLSDIPSEQP